MEENMISFTNNPVQIKTPGHAMMHFCYKLPLINKLIDDEAYLKYVYFLCFGKKLNLKNPLAFSEKLQWLKLYDRRSVYTEMVDKYNAKAYVDGIIGSQYIIPTFGVWERFEEIDFEKLPDQFVLKCTHDSGGLVICTDKSKFDIKAAKKKIDKCLRNDYYYLGREWPYKNVQKRIIAEQLLINETNNIPEDYKVFNFNGEPLLIQVDLNRFNNHKKKLYFTNWKECEFEFNYPNDRDKTINKPKELELMLELAKKLSKDIPFLRTDFYVIGGHIYFGELTFFPASGFGKFVPKFWDMEFGEKLILPSKCELIK